MIGQLIRYELQEGVAFLTLNNPGRRNALSTELLGELKELFHEFEDNDEVQGSGSAIRGSGFQFWP